MSFVDAIKKNKKIYIVIMASITVLLVYNESVQFWKNITLGSWVDMSIMVIMFLIFINAGISLKIWENEK